MEMEDYYHQWGDNLLSGYKGARKMHIDRALIVGMGGSGIVGHIARDIVNTLDLEIEIEVENTPHIPRWRAMCKTLILISHSGNTLETLEAADRLSEEAVETVAISTGGKLLETARDKGWIGIKVDPAPLPRLGLPQMLGALLKTLGVDENMVREASQQLSGEMRGIRSKADELADWLDSRNEVYVAYPLHLSSLGLRMWQMMAENAKRGVYLAPYPEASHNIIEAMMKNREGRGVYLVSTGDKYGEALKRIATGEGIDLYKADIDPSTNIIGGVLKTIATQDLATIHYARKKGVDPAATPYIDRFKELIREWRG